MPNYIQLLNLKKHIEGGYFGDFYKSQDKVIALNNRYNNTTQRSESTEVKAENERSAGSSIYFLLEKEDFSAWHRLKSDEIWHYYNGDSPIDIHIIDENGQLQSHTLGNHNITENASFQITIKAGCWFAAEVRDKNSFGLVGCTVSPGFEYQDFELAERDALIKKYPQLSDMVNKFIRCENNSSLNEQATHNEIPSPYSKKTSSPKEYIEKLKLEKHIEGGYYSVFYTSQDQVIPLHHRYKNSAVNQHEVESKTEEQRCSGSSIYFLLEKEDFSAWHKLNSDEIWHYYDGSPIDIYIINEQGQLQTRTLGDPNITENASFQVIIEAGCWFAAEVRDKNSFGLVGCTVSPGFEFKDFQLAERKNLIAEYNEHEDIIKKFTRDQPNNNQSWTKKAVKDAIIALASGLGLSFIQKTFFGEAETLNKNLSSTSSPPNKI